MLNLPSYELDPPFRGATHVKIYYIHAKTTND